MKQISFFGKYQYEQTILHRIDARIKITLVFALIVFTFFLKSYFSYIVLLVIIFSLMLIAKAKPRSIFVALRPIIFLIVFSTIFQVFFTPGRVIFSFGYLRITEEGLILALYITLRLVILSLLTFLLTSTTSTVELADALRRLIAPLKRVRFPSEELALMISIALQFIPILFNEADRIMKAQASRGVDFNEGDVIKRGKSFFPIILPLLVNAFERADQLAMAMESRGFVVGAKRTSYYERKLSRVDAASVIIVFAFCLFILMFDRGLWKITF